MKDRPKITKIEVHQFEIETRDVALDPIASIPIVDDGDAIVTQRALPIRIRNEPGAVVMRRAHAIRIFSDIGITGDYVGGNATEYSAIPQFAYSLIGRNALDREAIYNDAKWALRQRARMGMS